MKKLYVFDLDGTLADTRADLAVAVSKALSQNGFPPLPEPEVAVRVGDGARQLMERCLKAVTQAPITELQIEKVLQDFLTAYFSAPMVHTTSYEGAKEVLGILTARKEITLAVLTNKPLEPAEIILRGLGLRHYFGSVLGGDSVHGLKPDPQGLNYLIKLNGSSAQSTILVGDGWQDWEAAKNAEVPFIAHLGGMGSADELRQRGFRFGFTHYHEFAQKLFTWENELLTHSVNDPLAL